MKRLNVMHLVWRLDAAGMENGVINICHGLPSDEFAPSICTFQAGGAAEQRVNPQHVALMNRQRHFGKDPTLALRLAWLLRRRRVDILHTHNWVTLMHGLPAAKLARVPLIIHGEHGKIQDRPRQIVAQRWSWRHVDQVLSVSTALADRMAECIGFPSTKIQVISNGVDTDRFQPSSLAKHELRRQLALPVDGFLVGMVARLVPFKNHNGMLQALAQLRGAGVEIHLALAGDGPLRAELAELAQTLNVADRVHFLGELADTSRLLGALDVLVSNSSHNEGMSNAILEAMACGIPVVATRVAASPELLDEGAAGILVAPRDIGELAAAIGRLQHDVAQRLALGKNARLRVEQSYSITSMVESYRQLYLQLAGRHLVPRNSGISTQAAT
jgi:L-malate glycosyltransferase